MAQRAASGAAPAAASCSRGVDSLMLVVRIGQSPDRRTGEQSNALASPARSSAAAVAFTPASGTSRTPSQAASARECVGAPGVDCSAVGERGLCRQRLQAAEPSACARHDCMHSLDADRLARRCGPSTAPGRNARTCRGAVSAVCDACRRARVLTTAQQPAGVFRAPMQCCRCAGPTAGAWRRS